MQGTKCKILAGLGRKRSTILHLTLKCYFLSVVPLLLYEGWWGFTIDRADTFSSSSFRALNFENVFQSIRFWECFFRALNFENGKSSDSWTGRRSCPTRGKHNSENTCVLHMLGGDLQFWLHFDLFLYNKHNSTARENTLWQVINMVLNILYIGGI